MPAHPTPLLERDAEVRRRLAAAVGPAGLGAAWAAYEQARMAGLCHDGAWEVALGARPAEAAPEGMAPVTRPARPR